MNNGMNDDTKADQNGSSATKKFGLIQKKVSQSEEVKFDYDQSLSELCSRVKQTISAIPPVEDHTLQI